DQAFIDQNVTVSLNTVGVNRHTITLTVKDGRIFNNNQATITSVQFEVIDQVLITRPRTSLGEIPTASELQNSLHTVATLSKLFTSFNTADLSRVTSVVEGTGSNTIVRLRANVGFLFSDGTNTTNTIVSIPFTPR
ncbi:MAG: hypothetical protein ACRCW3_02765, partial [Metamycoplasmataceae bacterium]